MCFEQNGEIIYELSETSFVARQGEEHFLLQFGKLGLTLTQEEMRLLNGMMRMTKTTMERGGLPDDAVIARARYGDVQQSAEGFYLVRIFNCHLSMCQKMLLVLIELCVGAWERISGKPTEKIMAIVDADIVEILEAIEKKA